MGKASAYTTLVRDGFAREQANGTNRRYAVARTGSPLFRRLATGGASASLPVMNEPEPNPGLDRVRHQLRAHGIRGETPNPLRSGVHSRGYLPQVKREVASYLSLIHI